MQNLPLPLREGVIRLSETKANWGRGIWRAQLCPDIADGKYREHLGITAIYLNVMAAIRYMARIPSRPVTAPLPCARLAVEKHLAVAIHGRQSIWATSSWGAKHPLSLFSFLLIQLGGSYCLQAPVNAT